MSHNEQPSFKHRDCNKHSTHLHLYQHSVVLGMTSTQMGEPAQSSPDIQLHKLSSASPKDQIACILELSRTIFEPENSTPTQPQLQLSTWLDRLSRKDACLIYAASTSTPTTPPTTLPASHQTTHPTSPDTHTRPLGFFCSYPNTTSELNNVVTFHIWIAGIHPSSRARGIFPLLLEATKSHARERGYTTMTVCTYPERFTRMWDVLRRTGWEVVAEKEGGKVLLKIAL